MKGLNNNYLNFHLFSTLRTYCTCFKQEAAMYYLIICDFKNLIAFGHKKLYLVSSHTQRVLYLQWKCRHVHNKSMPTSGCNISCVTGCVWLRFMCNFPDFLREPIAGLPEGAFSYSFITFGKLQVAFTVLGCHSLLLP